jgi:hypothetical protein
MSTTLAKQRRIRRSELRAAIRYELDDFFRYSGSIDWITLILLTAPGFFLGFLGSFLLEQNDEILLLANPVMGIGAALLGMLIGGSLFFGAVSAVMVMVVVAENILDRRSERKDRITTLRYNTRYLKRSIVRGRVPLDVNETVAHELHRRSTETLAADAGRYERYLWRRWQNQRNQTRVALERSWEQDLEAAIGMLEKEYGQLMPGQVDASYPDETDVAWHLVHQPANVAVRRLLAEYVPVERDEFSGRLLFRRGVVYTPRWVYDLAAFGEQHTHLQTAYPMFQPSYRNSKVVGDESVPIGNADRETVEKLYDPNGDGPFRSLKETVETAQRL